MIARIINRLKDKKAFTLVELSVVLFIIALVLGASLSLGSARVSSEKIKQTIERRQIIMDTLERYITAGGDTIVNGIPCPADGSLVATSANFGIGTVCTASGDGRFVVDQGGGTHHLVIGSVPVRTLNLPDDYELDGFNNKFTWVMDDTYNTAAGLSSNATPSTITMRPSAGGANITMAAALVLISHGPDGFGAWNKAGKRITKDPTPNADEKQEILCGTDISAPNCQTGGTENVFVIKTPSGSFDDLVTYAMRWQLIPPSKGIVANGDPTCNRPSPTVAGANGLANAPAYTCPTAPRRCLLTYSRSTMANTTCPNATDADGCFLDSAPVDEASASVNLQYTATNGTNLSSQPMFICIAPDGSSVLCKAKTTFSSGSANIYPVNPVTTFKGTEVWTISPDFTAGSCVWWQY